jgi:hypothetical protein
MRAGLTVFGHSDDSATFLRSDTSNHDRAKQKQRDQGIAENASEVARKTCFGAAGSFQGGRERHPFKIAADRRPDSLELRPTSRWSAAFAAESRVEVRRPDTQSVAQIVHRGRREVLAPKQQYGDLQRRVTRLGRARSDPEHAFNGSSLSKP